MSQPLSPIDIIPAAKAISLPGLFDERVSRSPRRTAYLQFDQQGRFWRSYSWEEMARRVAAFRLALVRAGLTQGERIGILLPNGVDWVALDLAAMSLGLVTVPLYLHDSSENIAFILSNAGVGLLAIDTQERWEKLQPHAAVCEEMHEVWLGDLPQGERVPGNRLSIDGFPPADADGVGSEKKVSLSGGDLATLVYTSGTTGQPKGVMLSHAAILWNAEAASSFIPPLATDTFLSILPLAHGFERTLGHYLPMMAGSTVAYARSIESLREDLQSVRPTVLLAVPRLYERFALAIKEQVKANRSKTWMLERSAEIGWRTWQARNHGGAEPSFGECMLFSVLKWLITRRAMEALGGRLRVAVSGGAPLRADVAHFLIGLGLPLVEGYGLTEAGPVVTASTIEDSLPGAAGRLLYGVEARFSEEGELLIRTPGVMQGYWRNDAATERALDANGWLRTGDVAHMSEGRLYIDGRLTDTVILSTGSKIDLAELESLILDDPLFEQVCITGTGQPSAVMVAVLDRRAWEKMALELHINPELPNAPGAHEALLARVASRLGARARHEQIRGIHATLDSWTVSGGLLTPTLKAKRRAVESKFREEVAALRARIDATRQQSTGNA